MPKMSKPRMNQSKRRNKQSGNNQKRSTRFRENVPRASSTVADDGRMIFNPTWNPQFLKVARTFQYSTTATDRAAGFAVIADPLVTPSVTVHAYVTGVFAPAISHIPGVAEFTTLFDQYRIMAVKYEMQYLTSSEAATLTTANAEQICTLLVYEDNDDITAPAATNAAWSSAIETGRVKKMIFPNKTNRFTYTVRPKTLTYINDVASTANARAFFQGQSPWLDPATTDAQYYGVKYMVQANLAPVTFTHFFRIYATYFVEWRARQ